MQLVYPGSDPIDWRQVCADYDLPITLYRDCIRESGDLGISDLSYHDRECFDDILHMELDFALHTDDIHTVTTEELEERERVALYRSFIERLYLAGASSDELPDYQDWSPVEA